MKKIGIDIDDTVMNTLDVIDKAALYYDKVYVENKGFKDKDKYDFKERFYWTGEIKKAFFEFFRKNKLYLKATPKGDALYYLDKLYEEGYEIYLDRSIVEEEYRAIMNEQKKYYKDFEGGRP